MSYGSNSFERSTDVWDEMRRRMEQLWDEMDGGQRATQMGTAWPRMNVLDNGDTLEVVAEVPGVGENDLTLNVHLEQLVLEGERRVRAPEGYATHRQERPSLRFARSITLPCRVDADRTRASLKDGVLTVVLPKAADARPRTIQVTTA